MATTISLLNMKGGVGKTTLAVQLAWHFHLVEKAKVLLVDLDPQFNTSQYTMDYASFQTHRKSVGTISDLLIDQPHLSLKQEKKKKHPSSIFYNLSKASGTRLDLLPADLSLAWVVKNPAQMDQKLNKILEKVVDKYDYILIDCAPTDSVLTTMALGASDYLLIPMKPDRFSTLGLINLLETIGTFKQNCIDPHLVKTLGLVFTQLTADSDLEATAISEVNAAANKATVAIFASSLPWSKSFLRSVTDQTSIANTWHAKPKAKLALKRIADEVKLRVNQLQIPVTSKTVPAKKAKGRKV